MFHLGMNGSSDYINRPIRSRLELARDLSLRAQSSNELDDIAGICDDFDVVFVATAKAKNGEPSFTFVSKNIEALTGYSSRELIGQNPSILQTNITCQAETGKIMPILEKGLDAEVHLINHKKDGSLFGCHLLVCEPPMRQRYPAADYFGFMCQCSLGDCPERMSVAAD